MKAIFLYLFLFSVCNVNSQAIRSARILEIKNYVKEKNYNQNIAFFLDFKIPSNKFRFFIFDLKKEKILEKGLVAHGSGSVISNSEKLRFSNIEGSYQSSLGKYAISNKYFGTFGWSYRLKGLEKSNSNALKRAIVMHALSCVKDSESSGKTCLSLGCPMLSEAFFLTAAKYIDASKKPIILYAYY